jgi:HK97 family phage major capsid protein
MKLRELQKALAAAMDAATAIDAAVPSGQLMTAEQRTEFDTHMATVATLKADIARAEQLATMQRSAPSIEVVADHSAEKPWGSMFEQLNAIRTHARTRGAVTDPRLMAALGANETVDAEGGFLVAPEYSATLWRRTYDTGTMLARCFQQPMSSNRLVIPAVDEDSRADGSRWGGIQSFYEAEAATYQGTKPKFRPMTLVAHKLTALIYATDELLDDGPAFRSYCDSVVPQELSFRMEDNIFNGPGAGAPLGFMKSGALVSIAKDNNQTAATVTSGNIFGMWKRMPSFCRPDSAWFINQEAEDQLWNLTRGSGTAVELLYTGPGERGNNSSYGVMMGRPVIPVEYAAALGTPGDIVLASLSQYCLATRGEAKVDTSIHVAFLTGEQAFRWQLRHDGQPFWKKPLTPKNGTATLSPFVAIAQRS